MRDRSRLHYTKIEEFKEYAKTKGYEVLETKGEYEVLRLKKNSTLILGYKRDNTDHVTTTGLGTHLVLKWIREKRITNDQDRSN